MGRDARAAERALAWSPRRAPSLADFEEIAAAAFRALPPDFRDLCSDLVIRVLDFADAEMLESVGLDNAYELLGLFEGSGLAQTGDVTWTGRMPNRVFLFRRPILDYWADYDETLGTLVGHVLVHEIGHHFGLSDDDMERIEAATD